MHLPEIEGRSVYISGKITNNEQAALQFAKAHKDCIESGAAYVFNPMAAAVQVKRPGWMHDDHMRADIHELTSGRIDVILQIDGWRESGGALLESAIADMCGIERIDWSESE
ncbi:MAG: DUF4406 domain-containing protein [Eggerthellaceae bacterium]|nr:DUF4406 domain-containing protein [Eggerthellaceae bacterium]MBQ9147786.1 DUF4406 domain-containing protein [Rikenellaceae bacterium]